MPKQSSSQPRLSWPEPYQPKRLKEQPAQDNT